MLVLQWLFLGCFSTVYEFITKFLLVYNVARFSTVNGIFTGFLRNFYGIIHGETFPFYSVRFVQFIPFYGV